MTKEEIIALLPYSAPFLFVDELLSVDENGCTGTFTFKESLSFYEGHFKGHPVTPGVILTETMAQIGLVCLGIYLNKDIAIDAMPFALTSSEVDFLKPVYPNEQVVVTSKKVYFRFNKLKCEVVMKNKKDEIVCKGTISGIKVV